MSLLRQLRRPVRLARAATLVAALAVAAPAQSGDGAPRPAAAGRTQAYGVGESLIYDVKFGMFNVGTARMDVLGIESVRGRPAYHTKLEIKGGVPGYRVHEVLESWIDLENQNSLRYVKETLEGKRVGRKEFEIYPERGIYQESGKPERPTVSAPLDDASFIFFVRGQPLAAGARYDFNRYYMPDRNPVTVVVQRREEIEVPAGPFSTVVVRPIIKAKGIFSQNGRAELWLTDDDRRLMVRMETKLPFGSISLRLREFSAGTVQGR